MDPKLFRQMLKRIVSKTIPLAAGAMLVTGCSTTPTTTDAPQTEQHSDAGGTIDTKTESGPGETSLEPGPGDAGPEKVVEATPDKVVQPEKTPEVTPEPGKPEVKVEVAPEVTPEPEVVPEPEKVPEPEVVPEPEMVPEPVQEVVAEKVPEVVTEPKVYTPTTTCSIASTAEDCAKRHQPDAAKGETFIAFLGPNDPKPLSYQQCVQLCQTKVKQMCPGGSYQGYFASVSVSVNSCSEKEGQNKKRVMVCNYDIRRGCAVAGRRPAGLQQTEEPAQTYPPELVNQVLSETEQAGAFFAELAYLEQAAVTAFEYLARELEHYDAPEELVELAKKGIDEEIEHAELMRMLAYAYGGHVQEVEVEPFQLRPLSEIALDNAREGCIRETFGALIAMWQSAHAEDEAVRRVMERIAHEESIHAALSWKIDEWIQTQLSDEDRKRCKEAHQEALAIIKEELQEEESPALIKHAGFPNREQSALLYQQLKGELWA